MSQLREECGIFGICRKDLGNVAEAAYFGLCALQHRGQESCGIAVNNDGLFRLFTEKGVVSEAIGEDILRDLGLGSMAIGHVRYGTDTEKGRVNAQPIVVDHLKGRMALANNGALINYVDLRKEYESQGSIFHTTSDAEVISCAITRERLTAPSLEDAVNRAMDKLEGSYSLVIMTPTKLIAVRDPMGFRPLCFGQTSEGSYAVASESCALDIIGAKKIRDVEPGEIIVFDRETVTTIRDHVGKAPRKLCVFEYIYFARPDSVLDGISVHEARLNAGRMLAGEQKAEADIVIGVPDSGIDGAIGYAMASGIPYGLGFIKNKYIGRTFIAPKQAIRETGVKVKLNPIASQVSGKRVVLVDDSVVRGTTSRQIVSLLRQAGAKEIHMRVTSPKFLNPCYYGTDIKRREDLIAVTHTTEGIAEAIGVDSLAFLSVDSAGKLGGGAGLCTACFDGKYPTAAPKTMEKDRFSKRLMRIGENT